MVRELLPTEPDYPFEGEQVFVWDDGEGRLGGFASVSVRPWSEACAAEPVPHVEAWYVAPELRGQGIGAQLIAAVEEWCRAAGFDELGSDAETDNVVSVAAHQRLGFKPGVRLQYFAKRLRP